MKNNLKLFLILSLAIMAANVHSQSVLTTLASFEEGAVNDFSTVTNAGGIHPRGTLLLGSDGAFYGTAYNGGSNGGGAVFKVTTNGVLTELMSFDERENPYAGLTVGKDGNFYGTTDRGTVFEVTTNGILTVLASSSEFGHANALAVDSDGNLYGTTESGSGGVFKMDTNGTVLWSVNFGLYPGGVDPWSGLTLGNDGIFYGTTYTGGTNSVGAIFSVTTNGDVNLLVSLDGVDLDDDNGVYTNATGEFISSGLTLGNDGFFYGTTYSGGVYGSGTIYQLSTNGAFKVLASFAAASPNDNYGQTNVTGMNPWAGLTMGPDGSLFGTADYGGLYGSGTVFQLTTNGTLVTLFSFPPSESGPDVLTNSSGFTPNALTLGRDGNLYGSTWKGGVNGNGTVFRINLTPNRILVDGPAFGVSSNQFSFNVLGTNSQAVVVEVSTNLASTNWFAVSTNTSGAVFFKFTEPQMTNTASRFYRTRYP